LNLLFLKDVLISEKTDSRNVIELFNDIKSCALELHFDFRQNDCKSCDIIRNQKLQKLYKYENLFFLLKSIFYQINLVKEKFK
jgi:hypothetical protein